VRLHRENHDGAAVGIVRRVPDALAIKTQLQPFHGLQGTVGLKNLFGAIPERPIAYFTGF
jgi:hypothetical protein